MAYTTIMFENPNTGESKSAPVGFSWTTFFFTFLPALFRGDWKWAAIMFILMPFTLGISNLVFMFIYNKLHMNDLIDSGYKAKSISSGDIEFVESKMKLNIPRLNS